MEKENCLKLDPKRFYKAISNVRRTHPPEILFSEVYPNTNASTMPHSIFPSMIPPDSFISSVPPYNFNSNWSSAVFPVMEPHHPEVISPYYEHYPHYPEVISPYQELLPHHPEVISHYHELPPHYPEVISHYNEIPPHYPEEISPYPELPLHYPAVVPLSSQPLNKSAHDLPSVVLHSAYQSKLSSPVPQSTIPTSNLLTKVSDLSPQSKTLSTVPDSKGPSSLHSSKVDSRSKASNYVHPSKESNVAEKSKVSNCENPSKLSSHVLQSTMSTSDRSVSYSSSDHSLKRLYQYELRSKVTPSHSSKKSQVSSLNDMASLPQSKMSSCEPASKVSNNLPLSKKSSSVSSSKKSQPVPKSNIIQSVPPSKVSDSAPQLKERKVKGPDAKGSKSVPPSKLSQSGPRSKASANPSNVTNPNILSSNNQPSTKISNSVQASKDSNAELSSKTCNSVHSSNESPSAVWTEWRPEPKVPRSKPREKGSLSVPKSEKPERPQPVCTLTRPDKNSTKNFTELAKAIHLDILKIHENSYFEDQDLDIDNSIRKAIRDLFLSKRDFFKTASDNIDPSSTNFYRKFLSWGLSLMGDDLTEEKIYEYIIKVCCCTISVQSDFPAWENIVKRNAIEAISECCVLYALQNVSIFGERLEKTDH